MIERRARVVVTVICVVHVALALLTARGTSVTVDEAGHIASGVAHHQQGTFASYRVNPPPARWLATLPVVLLFHPPQLAVLADEPGRRPEGAYGAELAAALGPRYPSAVFTARLFTIFLSAIGLLLVYVIGARANGARSGLIAATIYAFDPNLLAHASVLTSDVPASVSVLAVTWALLRYARKPALRQALVLGALLGLAQLAKFSGLVLYPALLVCLAVLAHRTKGTRRVRLVHVLAMIGISVVVLNAGYAFSGTFTRLDETTFVSRSLSGAPPGGALAPGNRFRGTLLGRLPVPLPRDYVIGIDLQRRDFEGSLRSYLDGAWHARGFWFFYAYTLVLKTPLGTLALFAVAAWRFVAARIEGRRLRASSLFLVVVPLSVFVFVSSQTGFSHHLRYVLPVIPFFALSVGSLGSALRSAGWSRRLFVVAAATSVASGALAVPHSLSYFNVLGGGWRHGDAHLIDSNVDWGQDLGRLGVWYRTHHDRPLRLAYFGGVDPHIVGLEYTLPPSLPEPGRYVVSVNFVRGMRFPAVDGASRQVTLPEGELDYFAAWEPVERIGTSLRVYDVSLHDANEARRRLGLPVL